MKIIKLKIKNINSFKGEFEIDFTKFQNSLFLITGPTGAGKTTIIDAITTALYNKTPRLSNPIALLNEDSKEAQIILTFQIKKDIYDIHWKVKRNKNTTIKRKLFKNNEEIADKTTLINEIILDILKIGFDEFTKSIVLAQGKFDAFLSADDKEKIKVLEKILNVKEYELLSAKIYEKTNSIKHKITHLKEKIQPLNEDEISQKENRLNELNSSISKLTLKKEVLKQNSILLKEKKSIQQEILTINENIQINLKSKDNLLKQLNELKFGNLEDFKNYYTKQINFLDEQILINEQISSLFKQQNTLQQTIQKETKNISSIETDINNLQNNLSKIILHKDKYLENFDKFTQLILELRNLKKQLTSQQEKEKKLKEKINNDKIELLNLQTQKPNIQKDVDYLKAKIIVLKYEKDRQLLTENSPCPLCGSLIHPYKKNPPISENIKEEFEKLQLQLEDISKNINKLTNSIEINKNILNNLEINNLIQQIISKEDLIPFDENQYEILKQKKEENNISLKKIDDIKKEIEKLSLQKNTLHIVVENNKTQLNQINSQIKNLSYNLKQKDAKKEKELLMQTYDKINEIDKQLSNKTDLIDNLEKELNYKQSLLKQISVDDKDYDKQIEKIETDLNIFTKETGKLEVEIKTLYTQLNKNKELQKQIQSLQKSFAIYEKLNDKIGSKNGDKFKKIAINYMMDSLLNICNLHLQKLSEKRYILQRSEKIENLELFVIDTYYANKKREVKTLSGGEKFLLSLALSFGLSDLVRNQVFIETMFLDEGFGSLSEDSLHLALNTLKEAKGRTIGIISHINTLKEDIDKQINIIKKSNGRSDIKINL